MVRRESVFVICALCALSLSLLGVTSPSTFASDEDPLLRVPISRDGSKVILIPVQLSGETIPCWFDTGATNHIFDTTLVNLLGPATKTQIVNDGTHREIKVGRHNPPIASAGRCRLRRDRDVGSFDLAGFRQASGENIRGILGLSFCEGRIIQLDFDSGFLQVWRRVGAQPDWGTECELSLRAKRLWFDHVHLAGASDSFMLDTGGLAAGLRVKSRLFDQLVQSGDLTRTASIKVHVSSGVTENRNGILERVSLGAFNLRDVAVAESNINTVGLSLLARFRVTIDLSGRRVYLKPGRTFHRPDVPDLSGLHMLLIDGNVVVKSVDDNSPAWVTGIQNDDKITWFQGKPVAEFRLSQIRRALRSADGDRIRLRILRDGQEKPVEFALKYGFWDNSFPLNRVP